MAVIPSSKGWSEDDWKRWFEELLGQVFERLESLKTDRKGAAVHVHESRKLLKRLRSGTRLVREGVNHESLRIFRLACRDAGRFLANSRDGTVRLQTFDLVWDKKDVKKSDGLAEVRERLVMQADEGERQARDCGKRALRLLKKVAVPPQRWSEMSKAPIRRGLRRMLKRARIDFLDLRDGRSDEFHEVRKRVKDLYYAVGALPEDANKEVVPIQSSLKQLSDTLGEENDLTVLMEWLDEHGYPKKKNAELWEPLEVRHAFLRERVMKEGMVLEVMADETLFRKQKLKVK